MVPSGLYARLCHAFSSFFFYLSLMIAVRTIISGSTVPIFAIFSPNESVLGTDNRSGPLFDISRDVAMATNFVEKWQTPLIRRSGVPKTE